MTDLTGVRVYSSRHLPPGKALIVNEPSGLFWGLYSSAPTIEVSRMDAADLMKLVLGPRPDWVKR